MLEDIPIALRSLRRKNLLTQEKLAELTGINKDTLYSYERDYNSIPLGKIEKILEVYKIETLYFFANIKEYIPDIDLQY